MSQIDTNSAMNWIKSLGHLPTEQMRRIRDEVREVEKRKQVAGVIKQEIGRRFEIVSDAHDIEEILLAAADARAIFGGEITYIIDIIDEGLVNFKLFAAALNGATLLNLIKMWEEKSSAAAARTRSHPAVDSNRRRTSRLPSAEEIVSAYLLNNSVAAPDRSTLLDDVRAALGRATGVVPATKTKKPRPAVPVKKSISAEYLVCLEDGKKFKSLKRHLRSQYNMSPEQYRQKWDLPDDYPMIAPDYSKFRVKKKTTRAQFLQKRSDRRKA